MSGLAIKSSSDKTVKYIFDIGSLVVESDAFHALTQYELANRTMDMAEHDK
jgi:hypothetical protein